MGNTEIQKWTVLKEEDVSPSPWFPLLRHTVKLQNGNIIDDYFFAPLGDVVILVALTPRHEVILVKQYKHGLGDILLELPGGMQQKEKSIIESALNELEEETGVKATASQLIALGKLANNATKTRQITYGFIVFDAEVTTVQKLDSTEMIDVINVPAPQVLQMVKDGEIWTVDSVAFILKAALLYPDVFGV
ncbi:8-oxo-dGTP pyrophosphatase MutT (NUDIX family) [Mucilaginibacter gracilis]|uniref:GDP-mannose pyrophosphatase n=1 Tax=Mucilaginibacter gracilis TaxID=423350 RepID=A0A495IZD7_9SPHI|nr:NUDIX hydrolase [Mucilaginibacter gracilis]RKR81374.1 8-oxo-dGTP pyrophosphatase MutT (NUDIX family) [Mucilaginibacter gracilis]